MIGIQPSEWIWKIPCRLDRSLLVQDLQFIHLIYEFHFCQLSERKKIVGNEQKGST